MLKRFRAYVLSPQVWLTAGMVCLGLAVLVGYHQDQMAANSVLARKVGMPPEVMIQDFGAEQHTNIINEIQILAEVELSRAIEMNLGSESAPVMVHAIPVFAVSPQSRPFAVQYLTKGSPRRPVPRAAAAHIDRDSRRLAASADRPIAVIVHEVTGAEALTPEMLGLNVIGIGGSGALVKIAGVNLNGVSLAEATTSALSQNGMVPAQETLVLSVYADGRESALAVEDMSAISNGLIIAGLSLIGIALVRVFNILPSLPRKQPRETFAQVDAVGSFPPVFQPIRTQEEIVDADEKAVQRSRRSSRILSRIVPTS